MKYETILTMSSANIKYGFGATNEVGFEMSELGSKRVMVVTDKNLSQSLPVQTALQSLSEYGIDAVLFDQTSIEPTDKSLMEAAAFAKEAGIDGFVGIGGGSAIDTAKAANLYTTYPADFLTYVNAPIGKGEPVPGALKPLIGIPTTAGTGSETTGVIIFDLLSMDVKTGIAHRYIRPNLGIIDPENTRTLPKIAAASTGFDVLVHAIESYTNLRYTKRQAPDHPRNRPAYQGSNPISDIWTVQAIEMVGKNLVEAVQHPENDEARDQMILAAMYAGIGFNNAGLHLPHGMSYPVSGMVKSYVPEGYPPGKPIIPHGMSVVLNAPAAFRFTGPANPERHLRAAGLLGADIEGVPADKAGEVLADHIVKLMRATGMPNGLSAVGYTEADVDKLVEGTLPQHRVTKLSPRQFTPQDLRQLFLDSLTLWDE
jgi:hydroxyacid-oxoacid transhydrogenase